MARQYNYIYKELVRDSNDVVGHVAYSLYKADKVQFLERFKKENEGKEPSEEDLKPFHDSCCLQANIIRYRMQALNILQGLISNTLNDTTRQIEEDYRNRQDQHLEDVVSRLIPRHAFFNGLVQSIIGAFIFALIVAAFAFIKTYSAQ